MADVMQEGGIAEGGFEHVFICCPDPQIFVKIAEEVVSELNGQVVGAQGMEKAVVAGAGEDGTEAALLNGAQTLELGGVDDVGVHAVQGDIAVDGVSDLHHGGFLLAVFLTLYIVFRGNAIFFGTMGPAMFPWEFRNFPKERILFICVKRNGKTCAFSPRKRRIF